MPVYASSSSFSTMSLSSLRETCRACVVIRTRFVYDSPARECSLVVHLFLILCFKADGKFKTAQANGNSQPAVNAINKTIVYAFRSPFTEKKHLSDSILMKINYGCVVMQIIQTSIFHRNDEKHLKRLNVKN